MKFTFGDKGELEVYLLNESVLPVTEKKEGREEKSICHRMK